MSGRPAKCKWCGEIIKDKSNAIKHQTHWYHKKCYEENKDKIIKTRYPKCKWCGEEIKDKTNAINIYNGWYHNNCYELYKIKVSPKCKECGKPIVDKQKDGVKRNGIYYCNDCCEKIEKKAESYKKLIKYIHNILADKVSSGIYKQISEYESKGMTYDGMLLTLRYLVEVKKIIFDPNSDNCIGLVELQYEEANNKYKTLNKLEMELDGSKEELIQYLENLYDNKIPKIVYKQLNDYINEYNMTYKGILLTLKYCIEDLEIPFDSRMGIGICVYNYEKAEDNWFKQKEINENIENFNFEDKTIIINKRFSGKIKKYKEIDIGEL